MIWVFLVVGGLVFNFTIGAFWAGIAKEKLENEGVTGFDAEGPLAVAVIFPLFSMVYTFGKTMAQNINESGD